MVLFSVNVFSAPVNQTHGVNLDTQNVAQPHCYGLWINSKFDQQIVSAYAPQSTSSMGYAYIMNATNFKIIMRTSNCSNTDGTYRICYFPLNSTNFLKANTQYLIGSDNGGANYQIKYTSAGTAPPINNSQIDFKGRFACGTTIGCNCSDGSANSTHAGAGDFNTWNLFQLQNISASPPSTNINFTSNTTQTGIFNQDWIYAQIVNNTPSTFSNITLWWSNGTLARSNATTTYPFSVNFTGLLDGSYVLNATNNSNTTQSFSIILDNVLPIISSNFVTGKSYFKNNVTGQFNFSDTNLFSWNVSIDGVTFANASNVAYTFYSYNLSYNISSLKVGLHNGQVTIKDGHTASAIDDMIIEEKGGLLFNAELIFKTNKLNEISIVAVNGKIGDSFSTERKTDRYSFDYVTSDVKESYSFVVDVKEKGFIVDKPNSPYGRWIVSGDNWCDFASETMDNSLTEIVQNDKDGYQFLVTTYPKRELVKESDKDIIITFNSVGELNIVTYNFTFYVVNGSESHTQQVLELNPSTFYLYMNLTDTGLTSSNVSARIFYNGSFSSPSVSNVSGLFTYTKSLSAPNVLANTLVSGYWEINVSGFEIVNISFNQNILDFNITDCNASNTSTLMNLSIFYENAPSTLLLSNIEYNFLVWFNNNKSNFINFSRSQTGASNFGICITNYNTTLNYDTYIQYTAVGGFTHRYYLYNESYTNVSKFVNVGNYNDTVSTSVLNLNVKDVSYFNYPNVVSRLQRFYVSENVWRDVQMDLSDDYGRAIFNVRERDTDYRLKFYDTNNVLLKTTNVIKFLCTGGLCDFTQIILPSSTSSNNLTYSYVYNNNTQVLNVSFYDNTLVTSSLRILVTQETGRGSLIICNNTLVGYQGNIACDTTGYNGTIGLRIYSTASPERPVFAVFIYKIVKDLLSSVGRQDAVFFGSAILIGITSFGVIISPVVAIALAVFSLIVLSWLGLLSFITITIITIIIIIAIILAIKIRI